MNKIKEAIDPQLPDEPQINPFDLWEGADFKLRILNDPNTKLPSYDKCVFDSPSALFDGDDDRIEEEVYNKLYPLQPEIARDKFKTYDELLARFNLVEGIIEKEPTAKPNPDYKEPKKHIDEDEDVKSNDTEELDPDIAALLK